jgi:putative addiction module component (TIGR02574 family)
MSSLAVLPLLGLDEYNSSMTEEAQKLLQKALSLPDHERAELAGNLLSSLETAVDADVDAAWQQEVSRRADEARSGKVKTVPWDDVQRKARALLDVQ